MRHPILAAGLVALLACPSCNVLDDEQVSSILFDVVTATASSLDGLVAAMSENPDAEVVDLVQEWAVAHGLWSLDYALEEIVNVVLGLLSGGDDAVDAALASGGGGPSARSAGDVRARWAVAHVAYGRHVGAVKTTIK